MISLKHTFSLFNLLLIAGMVYYSVELFYKTVESKMDFLQVTEQADAPLLDKQEQAALSPAQYKSIVARDLFNTSKSQIESPVADIKELKPTALNLKLWGTVAGGGTSAYAVIEDLKTRKQSLYRVGAPVQNATVKKILREKVILTVSGKDEILAMEKVNPEKTSARPLKRSAQRGRQITLERSFINDAVGNISNLLGQVRIRPYFQGGEPSGLSMTGIKPNSIFTRMGLKNGDVLTGVEGDKIRSVNDVIGLYQKLKSAPTVNLEVKRRNRPHTITYRIQ